MNDKQLLELLRDFDPSEDVEMTTVEEAREILGNVAKNITDGEISQIIEAFDNICKRAFIKARSEQTCPQNLMLNMSE
jgi:hypothetical protein